MKTIGYIVEMGTSYTTFKTQILKSPAAAGDFIGVCQRDGYWHIIGEDTKLFVPAKSIYWYKILTVRG